MVNGKDFKNLQHVYHLWSFLCIYIVYIYIYIRWKIFWCYLCHHWEFVQKSSRVISCFSCNFLKKQQKTHNWRRELILLWIIYREFFIRSSNPPYKVRGISGIFTRRVYFVKSLLQFDCLIRLQETIMMSKSHSCV